MAEFKDPDTGEITVINEFITAYPGGVTIYKEKNGKQFVNKDGKPLELILKEKDWSDPESIPSFLSFGSKSNEDKKKILTKRSRDNQFQKNRELHDKKEWIDGKGLEKPKKKTNFILNPKKHKKNG